MKKFLKRFIFLSPIAYGTYDQFFTDEQLLTRNLRAMKVGIQILYEYKFKFSEENENVNEIHEKIAKSLYEMCKDNDGLYVKFGQGVASMEHVLPPAYFKYFQMLQDQAKQSEFSKIEKIIKQDLGKEIDDLFLDFEKIPIASASIAQVHKAKLKDGTLVAVKVQKPNIRRQFYSDMFMHWLFCFVMEISFEIPILIFANKIEEELEKEIDFALESKNAEICRENFKKTKRDDIYIPKIYHEYTSQRTLVMEFIEGIKITHKQELEDNGFNIKSVIQQTIEAFAEQIFVTHFVHADPHPGNIFVRKNPKDKYKAQIVILDFGLCYPLSAEFANQYCKFWRSIFLNQQDGLKEVLKLWGIGNPDMFVSSQLMKPYKQGRPVNQKFTKEEVYEMQMKFKTDFKKVMSDANNFPNELLFVNRNMNLIRSINKRMGSVVNRVNVMAKYANIGIHDSIIEKNWNVFNFHVRLYISDIVYWIAQTWLKFRKQKSVEEVIEDEMKKSIENEYKKYGWKPIDHTTYDS